MGSPPSAPPPAAPVPTPRHAAGAVVLWAVAVLPLVGLRIAGARLSFTGPVYLPLHATLEVALALVGFATFAVQWYAGRAQAREARARFVGAAFLAMALLGTAHLLVFPGMPGLFGPSSVERGIYYWFLCRACMVGSLVAATYIPPASEHPLLRRGPLLLGSLALVAAATALDVAGAVPAGVFYREGRGLTALKIGLELALALLAAAGAAVQWARWRSTGERALLRLAAALGLTVLAEVSLALFQGPYDAYNLLGHGYALLAAALMFDGLFVTALVDPYRRLDATTRELAASNARLDQLRAHVEGELAATIARLGEISAREQHARAELEAAFAAAPEAIVVYSAEGRVLRTNSAADRLFGGGEPARDESLVERLARLRLETTDGKPLPLDQNPVVRALRGSPVQGVPVSMETADGRRLWISISAAPTRGADGRLDGAVAAVADVGTLQRLQSQRDDLLRAVSHDLRNPLQIILLQGERLQRLLAGSPLEKERTSAGRIVYAAKQMGIMIRDLVEAARMESGRLALQPQPLELRPFVERLLAQAAGALDVARVKVEVPPDVPAVHADPARLERVVVNLVANALKYSPEESEVRVSAEARDDGVQVTVVDRGVGIAPEDLPHVFERFYRGQRTLRSDGLGLGLYIVQILVEAHGGRVWVESGEGQGATFAFTLPRAPRAAAG